MRISDQEAKLYFELMWSLQYFVGQKLNIISKIKSVEQYAKCNLKQKQKVRGALFADKALIEAFVQENTCNLSEENLEIVLGWQDAVQGKFFIERFLKKHTIFIQDNNVYGVMGLYDGINNIIPQTALPIYVNAILLPFKEKIIYDGLFEPYNVFFSSGIRSELKECYMKAKKNGQIIERLNAVLEVA